MPEHYTVFRQPGVFAGWPAYHGLWQRDGRILVGFDVGAMDVHGGFHAIDRRSPVTPMMAETMDGGETWECWKPEGILELRLSRRRFTERDDEFAMRDVIHPGNGLEPVEFTQQIAKFRMMDINQGFSYANYSDDFGRSWSGPWWFEHNGGEDITEFGGLWNRAGINARTSYLTIPGEPKGCRAFMSAAKESDGREGQPFCIETVDGGVSWDFLSWIDDVPKHCFGIMPSAVRLASGSVICAVRWRERDFEYKYGTEDDPFEAGIVVYRSDDECRTWRKIAIPIYGLWHAGNPPDLIQMANGKLVLVFGYRNRPCSIVYQTSDDEGASWSKPGVIRKDAGCPDMGYTRSAVRADGKVVSVYYWNDSRESERYIAATVWEPVA